MEKPNRKSSPLINAGSITSPLSLPNVTAQSYAIFDMKSGNMIKGRKENLKREIASLTKIMTFYTVIDILDHA